VREQGVHYANDFLSTAERSSMLNMANDFVKLSGKEFNITFGPQRYAIFGPKALRETIQRKNISWSIATLKLISLAARHNFSLIAKKLKPGANLSRIDCYKARSADKPIIPWHCDAAYSGAKQVTSLVNPEFGCIKFFIYLTEVRPPLGGALAYLPESHKFTWLIRKMMWDNVIPYSPFWSLSDAYELAKDSKFRQRVVSYGGEDLVDRFLERALFIESGDTSKFDCALNAGGVVVFDEQGFHRGAPTKPDQERIVFRFLYQQL